MKKILFIFLITLKTAVFAQVGIGTSTPHNSAMLDVTATDKGVLFPKMTAAQRVAIVSPAAGLHVYDTDSKALWYHNGSYWVNTQAMATIGDVKSGMQTADHAGWIKLDGRGISSTTLTATQRSEAIKLGFATSLPNATEAYPVQKTGTIGSVTGSNTTTLTQANLPSITLSGSTNYESPHGHTGTANTAGSHYHGGGARIGAPGGGASTGGGVTTYYGTESAGAHSHSLSIDSAGGHSHSVNVPLGGSNAAINIAPKSMIVNMFIYLGN